VPQDLPVNPSLILDAAVRPLLLLHLLDRFGKQVLGCGIRLPSDHGQSQPDLSPVAEAFMSGAHHSPSKEPTLDSTSPECLIWDVSAYDNA
jgi:hypothetical protein